MNKWMEIIIGLILINLIVYIWSINLWGMGEAAFSFLRGGIIWLIIFIGILFIALGISDLGD